MKRHDLIESGRGFRELRGVLTSAGTLMAHFATDEACRDYLFSERYPKGFICRFCSNARFEWLSDKALRCLHCRRRASLTAGTILHGTRKPLRLWFRAIVLVVQHGANAKDLQRTLNLTYKIAWQWAHKLRQLMKRQTTLETPVPAFDLDRWLHLDRAFVKNRFRLWFVQNGHFQWFADRRPGELGTCCQRLMKPDWDDPEPRSERDQLERWPLVRAAKENLFRAYSGHVSDKHLRVYLEEMEFRINFRGPGRDAAAVELVTRIAGSTPFTYRMLTGIPPSRPPIVFRGASPLTVPLKALVI